MGRIGNTATVGKKFAHRIKRGEEVYPRNLSLFSFESIREKALYWLRGKEVCPLNLNLFSYEVRERALSQEVLEIQSFRKHCDQNKSKFVAAI